MPEKVLDLFDEMVIKPDEFTLTLLFSACAHVSNDQAMKIGKKLLDQMPNSFRNSTILLTSAIHMLMRFGDVTSAEHLFDRIKKKDAITYGAMMKGNLIFIIF